MSLILSKTQLFPKYFLLARKLSFKSTHPKHKLGAVVVKKNKILGLGFNKLKTAPHANTAFNQIHAEIDAINDKDKYDMYGATVYVYRELQNGNPALAKPCIYCQKELQRRGIKNCLYTENEFTVGELNLNE